MRMRRLRNGQRANIAHLSRIWNPCGLSALTKGEIFALCRTGNDDGEYIINRVEGRRFSEYSRPSGATLRAGLINKDIDALLRKSQQRQIIDADIYMEYGSVRGEIDYLLRANVADMGFLTGPKLPTGRAIADIPISIFRILAGAHRFSAPP